MDQDYGRSRGIVIRPEGPRAGWVGFLLRGTSDAVAVPARSGVEPRPPNGFTKFLVRRMASPDTSVSDDFYRAACIACIAV